MSSRKKNKRTQLTKEALSGISAQRGGAAGRKTESQGAPRSASQKRIAKAARVAKPAAPAPTRPFNRSHMLWLMGILVPLTLWSYWTTFVWMEEQWRLEPDYSHGYLVIPLALVMLYLRRDLFPGLAANINWAGFSLLGLAVALRIVGRFAYFDFLDGWTLAIWVAGLVWIFAGRRVLVWAAPALVFLILLVPLPFRAESLLSTQLQSVATDLSVASLQTMGFPALPEGNTIWLDDHQMFVEEACSGLRIFVGLGAMAYFFAVLARRSWIDKLVLMASAPFIAILVNVLRVTGTVLAHHYFSNWGARFAHDLFGIVMVVIGAGLLMAVKSYWEHLYRPPPRQASSQALAMNG